MIHVGLIHHVGFHCGFAYVRDEKQLFLFGAPHQITGILTKVPDVMLALYDQQASLSLTLPDHSSDLHVIALDASDTLHITALYERGDGSGCRPVTPEEHYRAITICRHALPLTNFIKRKGETDERS